MPASSAASMMAKLSASPVSRPKFMVPRQSRLTRRPVRPRFTYCMPALLLAVLDPSREPLQKACPAAADARLPEAGDDAVEGVVQRRPPRPPAVGKEGELRRGAGDAGRGHSDQTQRLARSMLLPERERRPGERLAVVGRLRERRLEDKQAE